MKIKTSSKALLADTVTPVSLYLRLRDNYNNPLLLESSDYHARENSLSLLCFDPLCTFEVKGNKITSSLVDSELEGDVTDQLDQFMASVKVDGEPSLQRFNGFFGYSSFDAVTHFETIELKNKDKQQIPDLHYAFYRFIIVFNHFKNSMQVLENLPEGEESAMKDVLTLIESQDFAVFDFQTQGESTSNMDDEEFRKLVRAGKKHCQRGDVFQVVFSRQFSQKFKGDEFNVYRTLRSINPSPYLFYFDYGSFKIFGSSPEAQVVINNGVAQIHPIAGTYKRTGNDEEDKAEALKLSADPKENAEHVMLVDLARNDLSRTTKDVRVVRYREVQYFSHVIHLTSKVEGRVPEGSSPAKILADSFPAGTLSGAPKYKAMQLIDQYENQKRGYYGGAIGFFNLNGEMNHAILIRSFLSKNNFLHSQAGAGIVIDSEEESELQEVNHKLGALTLALKQANKIGYE